MATQIYTFHIEYKDIPDKIWRDIQVSGNKTLADLGYTILASFDTLAYHLFNIKVNGITYVTDLDLYSEDELMRDYKISKLNLSVGNVLEMVYDYGYEQEFTIKLLTVEDMPKHSSNSYPKIIAGAGRGIIDDMPSYELKKIIDETDANGESSFKIAYNTSFEYIYDYRRFNIEAENSLLKVDTRLIKDAYENPEEDY